MENTPFAQSDLIEAGISQPYASLILAGKRKFPLGLAAYLYRKKGLRHESLNGLTDEQIEGLTIVHPWPRAQEEEAA